MDLDISFYAGLGCGICLGISVVAIKKYAGVFANAVKGANLTLPAPHEEYKLVLVVRTDLGMGKGKIVAQCTHAAVGCFEKSMKRDPAGLRLWQKSGQAKVAVKTDSLEEVKHMYELAKSMGLITSIIRDAGRTQVPPNSITVLGIGPAPKFVVDRVTGHLKLL